MKKDDDTQYAGRPIMAATAGGYTVAHVRELE